MVVAVVCGGLRWFAMVCGGLSFNHTAYVVCMRAISGPQGPMATEVSVSLRQSIRIHHSVPCSVPLRLDIIEWNSLAVHKKAGVWVMNADHQSTTYRPVLRHAPDVITHSKHWRCIR